MQEYSWRVWSKRIGSSTLILSWLAVSCFATPAQEAAPIHFGDPIIIESSDYIMIPVVKKKEQGMFFNVKLNSFNSDYSNFGNFRSESKVKFFSCRDVYDNIIFINKKTGEAHLLFSRPTAISAVFFPSENKKEGVIAASFLLFVCHPADTNGNGKVDGEDAAVVFLSDLNGMNLKQLTPSGTALKSWAYDDSTGQIFFRIQKDSNNDKKFDEHDEVLILKTDSQKPQMGQEMITDDMRKKIEEMSK